MPIRPELRTLYPRAWRELSHRVRFERALARSAQEFAVNIRSYAGSLINDGERLRAGERISSTMAESTVNAVIKSASPSAGRCRGPGAAPLCCCKPALAPWMARSGHCSTDGTRGRPTTTRTAPVR